MKRKTKITILILSLALTLAFSSLGAFAYAECDTGIGEAEDVSAPDNIQEGEAYGEAEGGESPAEAELPTNGDLTVGASTEEPPEETDDGEEENIFAAIYSLAIDEADKIFSLLAFIGTLIIAFAYRRGLLPLITRALSGFADTVSKIKGEISEKDIADEKYFKKLDEALSYTEEISRKAMGSMEKLTSELEEIKANGDKLEKMEKIFKCEVELLYEIFISSSLPQYQKDKIGESFSRMMASLAEGDAKNEKEK